MKNDVRDGHIRKNFAISNELDNLLRELAQEENTSQTRIVQNAVYQYAVSKRMSEALAKSKSFDEDSFTQALSKAFIEGLKKENLVVNPEALKER